MPPNVRQLPWILVVVAIAVSIMGYFTTAIATAEGGESKDSTKVATARLEDPTGALRTSGAFDRPAERSAATIDHAIEFAPRETEELPLMSREISIARMRQIRATYTPEFTSLEQRKPSADGTLGGPKTLSRGERQFIYRLKTEYGISVIGAHDGNTRNATDGFRPPVTLREKLQDLELIRIKRMMRVGGSDYPPIQKTTSRELLEEQVIKPHRRVRQKAKRDQPRPFKPICVLYGETSESEDQQ